MPVKAAASAGRRPAWDGSRGARAAGLSWRVHRPRQGDRHARHRTPRHHSPRRRGHAM